VIVAVVDTGIRTTHEDLATNLWRNPGEIPGDGIDNDGNGVVDDVFGYNGFSYNGNVLDDNGHGTHVAGTIGAMGDNGIGSAGVAWRVRLMAVKAFDSGGYGNVSAIVNGIDYARQMGAQVMNNSWGGSDYTYPVAVAVRANSNVTFTVVAEGGEPLSFQWRRNGFNIPGATGRSLTISSAQAADVGRYTVLITNVSGVALSTEARLRVLAPVSIVSQPAGATLPVDASFTTAATVAGDGPLFFQWRKNGNNIAGATASSLSIPNAAPIRCGSGRPSQ